MRALEVQTGGDAAEFNAWIVAEILERDLLATVGDGVIDLAEPAAADTTLDRVAIERSVTLLEREHRCYSFLRRRHAGANQHYPTTDPTFGDGECAESDRRTPATSVNCPGT